VTADEICNFAAFFSLDHCIQIPNINLEAFAESRVGKLSLKLDPALTKVYNPDSTQLQVALTTFAGMLQLRPSSFWRYA
jgi:hypothetical protein